MATKNDKIFSPKVGTLNKDATLFFNEMENMIGASRLQHTSSMMELPSNFLHEIIHERDEEYDQMRKKKNKDDLKVLDEEDEYEYADDDDEDDTDHDDTDHDDTDHDEEALHEANGGHNKEYDNSSNKSSSNLTNKSQELPVWTPAPTSVDVDDDEDMSFPSVGPARRRSNGLTELSNDLAVANGPKRPSQKMLTNLVSIQSADDDEDSYSSLSSTDEDEEQKDDEIALPSDSESHTLSLDESLWNAYDSLRSDKFKECTIRFEEDELNDSSSVRLQNASQFMSLQFFFQFVYDRFHSYSQFLLDTSLPTYYEWKKMRKVRIRNASLKTVDYALKGCILSVDSIKAVVRNCLILCFDRTQPVSEYTFGACAAPHIDQTTFSVRDLSILAAFDLFDNGSSPSTNDWNIALSQNEGIAQKLSCSLPDLSHLSNEGELRASCLAFHKGKTYQFNIICEWLASAASDKHLAFGAGPIEWKVIKNYFVQKHGTNNKILGAFDALSYFVNPQISAINALMNDKNDKYVSKRRVIAEPIMWLYYMVSFLIQRQEKLQQLYITAMTYTTTNANDSNKQKLNALVTNLAKQAKDESERLRAIMAKLPSTDDLKRTLTNLVTSRALNSPKDYQNYVNSLSEYKF